MAKVVGDIAVQVGADVSNLQAGMEKAGRSVGAFDNQTSKMAANVAKVGAAIGVALVGVAVGMAKLAGDAANTAKEIQNLSNISGVGAEKFQRYSQAARSVGIEQDKLADIFKDVNDKFGDFLETGAGPLADFFENIAPHVGVTAEQFARLSGPQALQLYVSSLEKAGFSQQRMTFYLEALASDATALLPLLKDNGAEFTRLGDEAQRAGRVLSDDAVRGGAELDDKLRELSDTLKTNLNEAILSNSDEILALAETVTEDWIPALVSVAGFIGSVVSAISTLVSEIGSAMGAILDFASMVDEQLFGLDDDNGALNDKLDKAGWVQVGENEEGDQAAEGRLALTGDAMEAQEEARSAALERLAEFRQAQQEIEEEADKKLVDGRAKTVEDLAEIERRARQARFRDVSNAFGDLSALMLAENKKLFKIGQAAAIAESIVSGYAAAVSAWEKGMTIGGPPLAAAFTAASLARTGALISSIASTSASSGGGGTGGGKGGSGAADLVADPVERQIAEFRFTGGDLFSGQAIIDAINDAQDRGYTIKAVRS